MDARLSMDKSNGKLVDAEQVSGIRRQVLGGTAVSNQLSAFSFGGPYKILLIL
jgi:hypothetical protein